MPPEASDHTVCDVAVIGAGIAGLTTSIYLRQAGLRVVWLDRQSHPHSKVGESLDWSSPWLLQTVVVARVWVAGWIMVGRIAGRLSGAWPLSRGSRRLRS